MPDRAGEHRSPANCRCHQRGHDLFSFSGDPRRHLLPGIEPQADGHHAEPTQARGPASVPGGEGVRRERQSLSPGDWTQRTA
ncbi:hypothetical protein HVIM_03978 [Roseomonas mucosa]|nr:hypothetical protein HVIM_03978 [Roseomonas mucosa]QDD98236.1 hypothetical protein ADP8_03978 [Roseomonas mucosa]